MDAGNIKPDQPFQVDLYRKGPVWDEHWRVVQCMDNKYYIFHVTTAHIGQAYASGFDHQADAVNTLIGYIQSL